MTIRPTIARVVIPASLPTLPLRAPDLKAPITPATKKQQPAEAEKPSRGFLDTLRDMLWHPRGIGQSSSVGKRYYTPDEIQEMTPEKLAEDERRKKMADAGLRAAAEGASAASGLLPANQGSAISGAATTVISDQVDRAVTRGSTVPNDEPADPTQPTPPKDQPTARPGNTTAPPTTAPQTRRRRRRLRRPNPRPTAASACGTTTSASSTSTPTRCCRAGRRSRRRPPRRPRSIRPSRGRSSSARPARPTTPTSAGSSTRPAMSCCGAA